MNKPIELAIEETRNNLISVINESTLPHYVMLPILKDLVAEYDSESKQYTHSVITNYYKLVDDEKNEYNKGGDKLEETVD